MGSSIAVQILSVTTIVNAFIVMALLARKHRSAWILSLVNQSQWIALGILTGIVGFLISAVAFGTLAVYGLWKWGDDEDG